MTMAQGAFLLSIISLIISVRQHFISKAHNLVSTRPYINIIRETTNELRAVESDFKENPMAVGVVNIIVINNGIGPALVDSLRVYVDGKELAGTPDDIWDNARQKLFNVEESSSVVSLFRSKRFNLTKGYCIPAGKSVTVLSIDFGIQFAPKMRDAIERSRLVLKYQSFYKNKIYTYDTDKVKRGDTSDL